MIRRDKKGRITYVSLDDPVHTGHSVCGICGKDMPKCWDFVCEECNGTFCYDCANTKWAFWYCLNCRPWWLKKLFRSLFGLWRRI
ncbi:hypothetical protein KAR91_23160 [Candidatus Pacearchaeota archaeon]|nr:hypothetical protein [Candidatus Pacearchaeota archaeon]